MAPKELETTTIELADGPYELRASATKVLFDGFARVYTEGRDDDAADDDEETGRLPALAEGDATSVSRRDADPALHRAAAALHRGDADQGARGARHRPPVDLRGDDLDDHRPRLRPGRGAAAAPGARRRDRHRPARRALRRLRRRRVHGPDGGGARRGRPRRARLGAAAARLLRAAARPRRREAARAQAQRTSRPRRPTRSAREGHPMVIRLGRNGRFLACSMYPEHKESRPLPGDEPPPQEGTGEVCPKCGEGTLVGKRGRFGPFVGCSRYPDCDYIKKDGPPPPDPLPFEVDLPQEQGRSPRPASRAADRQRLLGLLELPAVRLHDQPRAARRPARRRRRPAGPQGRGGDLPRSAARRATRRPTASSRASATRADPPTPRPSPVRRAPEAARGPVERSQARRSPTRRRPVRWAHHARRRTRPVEPAADA